MEQKVNYSKVDSVFAWLSLILAFLFCHTIPVWNNPFGSFLLILALFITAFVVLGVKKVKLKPACILTSLSALILSCSFLLTETNFLLFLSCVYCLASILFLIYTAFGNRVENGFSNYIYMDYLKVLFILPFAGFSSLFSAILSDSSKKSTRFILKILIGLGIAIIPTTLVFGYLSYDDGFIKIIDDIFSFNPDNSAQWCMSVILTVPFAMYSYGLYTSSRRGILRDKFTAESCNKTQQKIRILPQITAVVAILPIIFLYVVFFISQWHYYLSGFTGVLPEGFSHAEYARQGFFELCAVSIINLLCISAIAIFIGRGRKGKGWILKILSVIFCLCTFILISTAVAKLMMYIEHYGLTQKRIYAMWLMAVIAVVFLVIALGQFISKVRIVALSCAVFIAMFTPLALCNVNSFVAEYNTDRYLAGTLEEMDTELMAELGDSAIPALVKLANSVDSTQNSELKQEIDAILFEKKAELRDERFQLFALNLPSAFAKTALEDYAPAIPPAGTYQVKYLRIYYGADEQNPGFQNYENDESAPILTIREDRTGTFTYDGFCHLVSFEDYRIIIGGEPFDISYHDDDEYDLTLNWFTKDERNGYIELDMLKEPVEEN